MSLQHQNMFKYIWMHHTKCSSHITSVLSDPQKEQQGLRCFRKKSIGIVLLCYRKLKKTTTTTHLYNTNLPCKSLPDCLLFAWSQREHKSRAVKRKSEREMLVGWKMVCQVILHSSHYLMIFQLTAFATVLLKLLTFFFPSAFSSNLFHCLGPARHHQQQDYTAPSDRLERFRFEQQNPAGAFPSSICSSQGLILHATAISQLGSSAWYSPSDFSAVLTKWIMRM